MYTSNPKTWFHSISEPHVCKLNQDHLVKTYLQRLALIRYQLKEISLSNRRKISWSPLSIYHKLIPKLFLRSNIGSHISRTTTDTFLKSVQIFIVSWVLPVICYALYICVCGFTIVSFDLIKANIIDARTWLMSLGCAWNPFA